MSAGAGVRAFGTLLGGSYARQADERGQLGFSIRKRLCPRADIQTVIISRAPFRLSVWRLSDTLGAVFMGADATPAPPRRVMNSRREPTRSGSPAMGKTRLSFCKGRSKRPRGV